MPLIADPVNFTWSLPSLATPCTHGVAGQEEDFRGEFFQKVKETKTTLDRIYLSALLRNKEKAVIYDYEKWARKGGKLTVKNPDEISQSSAQRRRSRPASGPVRALGVDERKIEAALHCGLWNDVKPQINRRQKTVRMPHIMARAQFYDLDDDYVSDMGKPSQRSDAYDLDSSKVYRVLQEETGAQANERLQKGKCGSWKRKNRFRRTYPTKNDQIFEAADEFSKSEFKITIEETHSQREGDIVTKTTHKQKMDFSTIKKRGVAKSDTVEYRLPKLNSTPIIHEEEEHVSNDDLLKLPLLVDVKHGQSEDKKKANKQCKKRSKHRRKKKSGENGEGGESSIRLNDTDNEHEDKDDVIKDEVNLETPRLDEVSSKLINIVKGRTDEDTKKKTKVRISCKKTNAEDDDPLTEYPFMTMGMDGTSDTDDECLCDECLTKMTSKKQPTASKTPIKSILSPRRRKRTTSTGSGKSVSFADTESLEDVRLISPLAVRNENMKKYEEEERRERLKERDMKRREIRRRERERFAALNKKPAKKTKERKEYVYPDPTKAGSRISSPKLECDDTLNDSSQNENVAANAGKQQNDNPTQTQNEKNDNLADSSNSASLNGPKEHENEAKDNDIALAPDSEVHEVEALMLDPQDGRLYEDIVLEKGNGKITVAQLGYRIKSIFDQDLPPPSCPKSSSSTSITTEVVDQDIDTTLEDEEVDDKDKPFVTKCVDWQETTESASTSRSATPVDKQDMSDFIMSMKNCRYIRWTKSYADMLEKMEQ